MNEVEWTVTIQIKTDKAAGWTESQIQANIERGLFDRFHPLDYRVEYRIIAIDKEEEED